MRLGFRPAVSVFWHEAYRPPLTGLEQAGAFNPRRADLALWYLLDAKVIRESEVRRPVPVTFEDLARVHTAAYLENLPSKATLGAIFATDPSDIPVDALLESVRLACGATVLAAQEALALKRDAMNLSGGFHHAWPDHGGGFCAVNDIAVAIAALRAQGFEGAVNVIDLDAHPPDGTAACLESDSKVWIGSLSAVSWGPLPRVHETTLSAGTADADYLAALDRLLEAMPAAGLALVVAGGDILAGDPLGKLAVTLDGLRKRDARVRQALKATPAVWLPGGGYHPSAWKALAGTVLALKGKMRQRIPEDFDPLTARFHRLSHQLNAERLQGSLNISTADVEADLGVAEKETRTLLGFYTPQGLEYALFRYGVLPFLERVGYRDFSVELRSTEAGDGLNLWGRWDGNQYLLLECVLSKRALSGLEYLFINWLSLRNPRAAFSATRPKLPGQEVPGLGIAREMGELFARMASRLGLAGVCFRPAYFHLARFARSRFRFLDPEREGRFEALLRDTAALSPLEATSAIATGRVTINGEPYTWEADDMVFRPGETVDPDPRVTRERERVHFAYRA